MSKAKLYFTANRNSKTIEHFWNVQFLFLSTTKGNAYFLQESFTTLTCTDSADIYLRTRYSSTYDGTSVTRKKSPYVYKSCPKMISIEKWSLLTPIQKLPRNVRDLGKLIVAKGLKKLPKVQKIARSGHTGWHIRIRVQRSTISYR